MTDMVERVARASFAFWKQQNSRVADFEDMNPEELEFAMAHARAMIEEMHDYLKKHDDGFQCQQCNAMVDVDEALGRNESQTKHE